MTVQTIRPQLTEDDILRLMRGETPEQRASVAHRLCRRIALDVLSDREKAFADEIIAILAEDAADLVRRTLAITLRSSPALPHDVALRLAHDIEAVAIPLLQDSPVFSDEDLVELVLSVTAAKQAAIASRESVSITVSEVITEHGAVEAVRALSINSGAEWTDKSFDDTLRRFGRDEIVQAGLIKRDFIPTHIAEKMVSLVSGQLFDILVNRHELPAQLAIDLAASARERATIDLVEQAGRTNDLPRFVSQLNLNGRLSNSLIMRALCCGQMRFVEHALSELSGVAHQRVWLMIHDAGPLGLQAVFDRAGLPRKMLPAFKAAVTVFHETQHDGGSNDRARFRARMIERVLTQFQAIPKDDLDYLLDKLDYYSEMATREDAREGIDAA
ncbi:MAG: DUF2336 domain-containing protein [Hyphomonas sp.]|uniref:DUF2336 domain-containing protein n=1 Tax=Hyphomonas sp. TaxID=87 RepID=UPI00179B66D8|nr:DUF2336 domain-containing protein [Hyphomonas sp.]MBA3067463.1 DUF2336 domain-containing protein [Hyphomonas sp.]MBU3919992.1 DUF2336 domain-containing protein [Alphaproteobacteria bacterium]MBU4063351.1 DUF2336 domain-containing protein [Alphaproteobacteria bacterium]MBU4165171.1 DUF2336 domain-containing protein [Alphaproteobacteria bacterium]